MNPPHKSDIYAACGCCCSDLINVRLNTAPHRRSFLRPCPGRNKPCTVSWMLAQHKLDCCVKPG